MAMSASSRRAEETECPPHPMLETPFLIVISDTSCCHRWGQPCNSGAEEDRDEHSEARLVVPCRRSRLSSQIQGLRPRFASLLLFHINSALIRHSYDTGSCFDTNSTLFRHSFDILSTPFRRLFGTSRCVETQICESSPLWMLWSSRTISLASA